MKMACKPEEVLEMLRDEGILVSEGELSPDGDLFEAGLDSMAVMQLIVLVEERFGVILGAEDANRETLGTARRLAATIHARR